MAIQFIGKSTFVSSNGSVTQTFPTYQAGDLLVLLFNSANQAPINNPTTAGYTLIDSQVIGSAGVAGGANIYAWYKFASASETAFVFGDSGDYNATLTLSFRGVDPTVPLAGTTTKSTTTAGTTFTAPGITTTFADAMIVHAIGLDADAASSSALTVPSNANLTSLTIQHAQSVSTQSGGGIAAITGFKAIAGASGNTTGTAATSAVKTYVTFALNPYIPTYNFSGTSSIATTSTFDLVGTKQVGSDLTLSAINLVSVIGSMNGYGFFDVSQLGSQIAVESKHNATGQIEVQQSTSIESSGTVFISYDRSGSLNLQANSLIEIQDKSNKSGITEIASLGGLNCVGNKGIRYDFQVYGNSETSSIGSKSGLRELHISSGSQFQSGGIKSGNGSLEIVTLPIIEILAILYQQTFNFSGVVQISVNNETTVYGLKNGFGDAGLVSLFGLALGYSIGTSERIVKPDRVAVIQNSAHVSTRSRGSPHKATIMTNHLHSNERGLSNVNQSIHRRNN